jgi:micrococcal nuclease
MSPIPILLTAAALVPLPGYAAAAARCERGPIAGPVTHVRAGDTVEVSGLPIRLQGLTAPELDEPGGEEAARAMWMLLHSQDVRCELTGERWHDRCIGVCYVSGTDVAAELVRAGAARDCPRFSGGRYADEEREAAREGAGITEAYRLPGYCRGR